MSKFPRSPRNTLLPIALAAMALTGFACSGADEGETTGTAGSGGGQAGSGGSVSTGRGGSTGAAGTTGVAGGAAGATGIAGTTGVAGTAGPAGSNGSAGTTGAAGSGTAGSPGRGGAAGGLTGTAGTTGRGGTGVAGTGAAGRGGAAGGGAGASAGATGTAGGSAGSTGRGGTTGIAGSGVAGSGAAGTSGGGSTGCSTPPAASPLTGWATVGAATTGGGNASPTTVTSLSALNTAVAGTNAAVVIVQGKLSPGVLKVGSNKTIIGVCGAEIHGHVEISGSTNVIIRNIAIVGYGVGNCSLDPDYDSSVGCSSGADAISVQKNANHIWFDHCDVSDGTDGNLDITNGANYVTVSWTKFHYSARTDNEGDDSTGASGHRFSNLIGGTDSPSSYDDANALNVTWHHNWWADRVVERQPRVRFGKNHLYNNLWASSGDNYCVRAGKQAQILVENSVFTGVKTPQQFNNDSDEGTANITVRNNVYTNTTGEMATGGGGPAFTSTTAYYTVTPEPTSGLEAAIRAGAGPK